MILSPNVDATPEQQRASYTAGLRALADVLDANPDLPLPYDGQSPTGPRVAVFTHSKDEAVGWARALRKVDKHYTDSSFGLELTGALEGLHLTVYAPRNEVCERVVTGTREVTTEIPDPEALAAVPTVTVTEIVEDVEWVCTPLLAPAAP